VTALHFVFDGCELPAKSATKEQREANRAQARARARLLKTTDQKAYRSLAIASFSRESWLENALRSYLENYKGQITISWEIALFEADAQLAHLLRLGLYDFGISEDQDIAMYGANCMIFKLGYSRAGWGYKANECDWMETLTWTETLPATADCKEGCEGYPINKCKLCSCAVGMTRLDLLQACV
jgi:exonuclease-1